MATLRRWAQALGQAGRDADAPVLTPWGRRLEAAAEQEAPSISALTLLLTAPELDTRARVLARTVRAREHRITGDYEHALADYATAHRLAPDTSRADAGRGETYRLMGRYDEALTDFDRVIELESTDGWAFYERALTHRSSGRGEGGGDLLRAIELLTTDAQETGHRGANGRANLVAAYCHGLLGRGGRGPHRLPGGPDLAQPDSRVA